jgi:hypothetical protein
MKNYIGFVNDHSGSMASLARAAVADYNATITAVKDAASREMLDTVVSVVGIGLGPNRQGRFGWGVERQVVISNPHVLKPLTSWPTPGGTPLYDGVGEMIELFLSLPDYQNQDVSFLVVTTTDGYEEHSSKYDAYSLKRKILELQATGRWTFVFRVPKGSKNAVSSLGVPLDNIQEWGTTAQGMAESTAATAKAVDTYFAARSVGAKSSTVFYANAATVNTAALVDISNKVSLYVVPGEDAGIQIRDFILRHRMEYLKGAAFYQLTKTEPRISHTKLIAIRERATGKIYSGSQARDMIGLPHDRNARLHPGDHGNYDLFIQSESVNRKLVGGTGVLYWKEQGVPFTAEELAKFAPKPVGTPIPAGPTVVQLPAVPVSTRPTPSPVAGLSLGDYVNGRPVQWFTTRSEARASGKTPQDAMAQGINAKKRWFVYK